jgi:hypothetical protein
MEGKKAPIQAAPINLPTPKTAKRLAKVRQGQPVNLLWVNMPHCPGLLALSADVPEPPCTISLNAPNETSLGAVHWRRRLDGTIVNRLTSRSSITIPSPSHKSKITLSHGRD